MEQTQKKELTPIEKAKLNIKSEIEDLFYEKTKDFVFNYYEEDEKRAELNDKINDCINEIFDELNWANKKIDEFLEDYEMYRRENLKEYEYNIKHRKY